MRPTFPQHGANIPLEQVLYAAYSFQKMFSGAISFSGSLNRTSFGGLTLTDRRQLEIRG